MDESVEGGIISAASTTQVLQVASVHNNNNNNAANNQSELNRDATIDSQTISRPKSPVPPKSNSTVANNNNNNNTSNNIGKNKPKSQGHQQNDQQLPQAGHHQFRTPQQFLRHRPAAKKNKPWNKRQHKTGKHNSSIGSGLNAIGLANSGGDLSSLHNTKADLENIQNQLGPGAHYLPNIHGHNNHPGHRGSCVGLNANSAAGGGIAGVGGGLAGDCNLSHGLNPKSQSYKKMPPHRGHNSHHALCPGGAHNSLGGGLHAANPTGAAGNMNSACCPLNACCNGGAVHSHTKEKDGSSIGGGDSGSGGSLCGCVCTLPQCCIRSKFFLNDKRPRKEVIVPPTKFLLGGNISDPLNLTSLQNECLSNASSNNNTPATTPRRSPITTPPKVEVIIPPNIRDPLHLLGPVDSREYEKQLTSPMKRCGRLIGPASGVGGVGGKGGDGPNAGIGQKLHKNRNRKNRKMQRRRRHESCNIPMVSSSDLLEKSVADVDILDNAASGHLPATESKTDDASKTCDDLTEERLALKSSPKSANVQNVASGPGERSSLRLDLTSGSMNNSSSSSIGGGSSCGGGRKRKISEGNHSNKFKKFSRLDTMDKIVSPVVPQPGAWKRPPRLLPSGARKPKKRSISEAELLSPVDESTLGTTTDSLHSDHLDVKSEIGIGSPLSTVSATTCGGDAAEPLIAAKSEGKPQCPVVVVAEPSAKVQNLLKMPKIQPDGKRYRFGNFDRYAGYRNVNEFMDVRLEVFQRNFELFHNKDILDIGCNVGCMTISVAKNLAPKSILGIDIDGELISRARHNLRTHVRIPKTTKETTTNSAAVKVEQTGENKSDETGRDKQSAVTSTVKSKNRRNKHNRGDGPVLSGQHQSHHHHSHHFHNNFLKTLKVDCKDMFPISFPLTYGPVPTFAGSYSTKSSTLASDAKNTFPENVFFRQSNYVLKDEAFMCNDMQQYDLILCLSVTKWIHLNFGDAGLKMAFKRMFNQLRPGGKLILEAQNWPSYKKRKNLTEEIYKNYMNIEFFPNKFHEYLLSSEVGFSHSYTLGVPQHMSKGFCRPIQLYAKGDFTPNHIRWSDAYYPQTPYEAYRGIYATMPPRPAGMSSSHPMSSSVRSQAYDTPHFTGGTSGPYSNRQTPMHQPTSQYYNPLETDSYLPSYDMEYLNHTYVFESPLYQTAWSPPASLRNSSSHTPHYGSVREAELDGSGASYPRHVYPPNEDTTSQSPNANGGGAFSSIRDPDTDDSNQIAHVYATNCSADGVVPSDDESPVITQPTSPSTI